MTDDYMGLVAYTTHGDLNVPIGEKANNEGLQWMSFDLVTTTTSKRVAPSFLLATQMLIDSHLSYRIHTTKGTVPEEAKK